MGITSVRTPTFFSSSTYSPPISMTSTLPARSMAMRVAGSGTFTNTSRFQCGTARQWFSTASYTMRSPRTCSTNFQGPVATGCRSAPCSPAVSM